mgnify:CR=1 FL=1
MIIKILLICSIIVNAGMALRTACLDIAVEKMLQDCKNNPVTRNEIIDHLPETIKSTLNEEIQRTTKEDENNEK